MYVASTIEISPRDARREEAAQTLTGRRRYVNAVMVHTGHTLVNGDRVRASVQASRSASC